MGENRPDQVCDEISSATLDQYWTISRLQTSCENLHIVCPSYISLVVHRVYKPNLICIFLCLSEFVAKRLRDNCIRFVNNFSFFSGDYMIEVTCFDQPILGSPFFAHASDISRVLVSNIPTGSVGQQSTFTSQCWHIHCLLLFAWHWGCFISSTLSLLSFA